MPSTWRRHAPKLAMKTPEWGSSGSLLIGTEVSLVSFSYESPEEDEIKSH
jgi:hypothetical protein